jgi:hypothetical protein
VTDGSLSDERLRAAFTSGSTGGAEPDLEAVQRVLDGQAAPQELHELVDRAAGDPDLALAWRLGVELRRELVGSGTARRWSRWALAAGLAAAVLAAVAVWWPPATAPPAPPPVSRGAEAAISSQVPVGAALPRKDFVLRWQAQLPTPIYSVEVLDGELGVLYRADGLLAPRLQVPAAALAGLPPGALVLWRVEAVAEDGSRHASPTFRQRLR